MAEKVGSSCLPVPVHEYVIIESLESYSDYYFWKQLSSREGNRTDIQHRAFITVGRWLRLRRPGAQRHLRL